MKIILYIAFFLSLNVLIAKPKFNKEKLSQEIERIISTPCSISDIYADTTKTKRFIKQLEKKYSFSFKRYESRKKDTYDYVFLSQQGNVLWSIWLSISKSGIEHITETWQTVSTVILHTNFYKSVRVMYPKWSDPVEEHNDFYMWDGSDYGCGSAMITMINDSTNSFVSRRLEFMIRK